MENEDNKCLCCGDQFCEKRVQGEKVHYTILLAWRVAKKFYKCPNCGSININQPEDPYNDYSEEYECKDCGEHFYPEDMKKVDPRTT